MVFILYQGETLVHLLSYDMGLLIVSICNALAFTYQATNFLMHYIINRKFSNKINQMICGKKNEKRMNTNATIDRSNNPIKNKSSAKGTQGSIKPLGSMNTTNDNNLNIISASNTIRSNTPAP